MHDNSRRTRIFCDFSHLDTFHCHFPRESQRFEGHTAALTMSDSSDSDSSGERDGAICKRKLVSHMLGMKDLRKDSKVGTVKEVFKGGKRYIGGKRKEVRFSTKNNTFYELKCREGDYDLFFCLEQYY